MKHSEETLSKLSIAKSGSNHPLFGKKHSSETIDKMRKSKTGENNVNYGKPMPRAQAIKISNTRKARRINVGKKQSKETIEKRIATFTAKREAKLSKQNND